MAAAPVKYDVQLAQVHRRGQLDALIAGGIRHGFTVVGLVVAIYVFFEGLSGVTHGLTPESLKGLALIVHEFNLGTIVSYVANILLGGTAAVQGFRANRANTKLQELRDRR